MRAAENQNEEMSLLEHVVPQVVRRHQRLHVHKHPITQVPLPLLQFVSGLTIGVPRPQVS